MIFAFEVAQHNPVAEESRVSLPALYHKLRRGVVMDHDILESEHILAGHAYVGVIVPGDKAPMSRRSQESAPFEPIVYAIVGAYPVDEEEEVEHPELSAA